MRILTLVSEPVEKNPAVSLAARLGPNLWANVDLLKVVQPEPGAEGRPGPSAVDSLVRARSFFLEQSGPEGPYALPELREEPSLIKPGRFEVKPEVKAGEKQLRLRIRTGEPGRELVHEAFEADADLIIMNIPDSGELTVKAAMRAAVEAPCSAMIIREEGEVGNMMLGVDAPRLSQTAREMLTQITTVFHAPAAMYTLHSMGQDPDRDPEVMNKLMKLLKAHDLNAVTAEAISADDGVQEIFRETTRNLLILR